MNGIDDGVTNQEDIWHPHALARDGNKLLDSIPKDAQATIQESDIVSTAKCQNFVKTLLNKNIRKRADKIQHVEFHVGYKLCNINLTDDSS